MRTRKWKSEFGLLMNSDLVFSFWISPLEVMMTMPTTPWEEIILIFAKIFEIKTFPISATEEVLRKSIREKTKKSFLERLKSRLETVCTLRDHLKRAADKTCKEIFSWRRPTDKILLGSWHTHTPQWSKAPWTIGTQLHGIVQFANCVICLYLGRYSKMYFGQVINTLIAFFSWNSMNITSSLTETVSVKHDEFPEFTFQCNLVSTYSDGDWILRLPTVTT